MSAAGGGGLPPLGDAGSALLGMLALTAGLWLGYGEVHWWRAQAREVGRVTEVARSPIERYQQRGRFFTTGGGASTFVELENGATCSGAGGWAPVGASVSVLWTRGTPDCEHATPIGTIDHWGLPMLLTVLGAGALARSLRQLRRDRDGRSP